MATPLIFRWLHGGSGTISTSSGTRRRRPPIQSTSYADSSTRLKNATPQTNDGCIHGGTVQLRLEGLKNRLEQLRPVPDQKRDDAQRKYAEGYKFANRMESWWKVETIVGRMESATGFDSCARMRFRYGVATSGNVHVSHCYPLPCSKLTPSDRPIADRYATND